MITMKWQLQIGQDTSIPFTRSGYMVAVKGVFVTFKANNRPSLFYITSSSCCSGDKFWIGTSPCSHVLKLCTHDRRSLSAGLYYEKRDLEFYSMDLAENCLFKISIIDERGALIECSGYCVLQIEDI